MRAMDGCGGNAGTGRGVRASREMSSGNIVRRKTYSFVLVVSEVAFGDDQSVIAVAVEWRGSSYEGDL